MKVNRLKKMLSVTLAAALLITSVPMGTYAGEPDTEETGGTETSTEAQKETAAEAQNESPAPSAAPAEDSEAGGDIEAAPSTAPAEDPGASGNTPAAPSAAPAEDLEAGGDTEAAPAENANTIGDTSGQQTPAEAPAGQDAAEQNPAPAEKAGEPAETNDASNDTQTSQAMDNILNNSPIAPIVETTVNVTWGNLEVVWNNGPQEPTAVADVEGVNVTLSYGGTSLTSDGKPQEPGTYTVTANISNPEEYPNMTLDEAARTKTFTITKKKVKAEDLSWEGLDDVTYTGNKIAIPTAKFNDIGNLPQGVNVSYEDGDIINAGSYTLNVAMPSELENHYELISDAITKEFEVKKCALTLKWEKDSATYNGQEQEFKYAIEKHGGTDKDNPKITVTYTNKNGPVTELKDADTYTANVTTDDPNHEIDSESKTHTLTISPCIIQLEWSGNAVTYDGKTHRLSYEVVEHSGDECEDELGNAISVTYEKEGTPVDGDPKDVGIYKATATLADSNHAFSESGEKTTTQDLTISKPGTVTVKPKKIEKVYDNKTTDLGYDFDWGNGEPNEKEALEKELKELLGESPLTYESEDVRTEPYLVTFKTEVQEKISTSNFNVAVDGTFKITPRPITITPDKDQGKYYGAKNDPELTYTVSEKDLEGANLTPDDVKAALDEMPLGREKGETVGEYKITFSGEPLNYTVTLNKDRVFTVRPLPVVVTPDANQEKLFGQVEPTLYGYTFEIDSANMNMTSATDLKKGDIRKELGDYILERAAGEGVGSYAFHIKAEDPGQYKDLYKGAKIGNYDLRVADNAPLFRIQRIRIEDVQAINSRQDSFKVMTNLTGKRQPGVTTGFRVEFVEYPESTGGVEYSKKIDDYISYATAGVTFTGSSDTILINPTEYSKTRKDNEKTLKWDGYLPAGATIAVSVVDAAGNVVSAHPVKVTVTPVEVTMKWSGFQVSPSLGNYVTTKGNKVNPLTLTGDKTGEWIEVVYNGKAAAYDTLDLQFAPKIQNAGQEHADQSVTAKIVDTLNLVATSQTLQFYVDDSAFPIPSSAIQFENRGEKVTIHLPEMGTLTAVSILGAKVELPGNLGQDFTLPVSWSGKNLIPTGAPVSVSYTDEAGHQGSGLAAAARSTVNTPITFRIRPELNANGYLSGPSEMLIVSGTACSCEPISVTVAGATQTTYSTQKEVWSDSNGSWETLFSLSSLPENQEFTISAEYTDVNGSGYSMTAKFDSFCASASIISPVYEAMSHISGMVEPGTTVALVINGDDQKYYEIEVDRFGHFMMNDVPMMFGGEDSFDIYVKDIAGNMSIRHYEIEEPGDPFEVTGKVNPLGKFIYSASQNDSVTFTATPVSASDFEDGKTGVAIPLLLGMSYQVGTMTLHRTEDGFAVTKEIAIDEDIAAEDYRFENEKLYVYAAKPSVDDLRNATGQEVQYGATISFDEDGTVWIVSESDMTILADDIMDLEVFDFEHSEEYVKYQEK